MLNEVFDFSFFLLRFIAYIQEIRNAYDELNFSLGTTLNNGIIKYYASDNFNGKKFKYIRLKII